MFEKYILNLEVYIFKAFALLSDFAGQLASCSSGVFVENKLDLVNGQFRPVVSWCKRGEM
jgi:hypothetical protein